MYQNLIRILGSKEGCQNNLKRSVTEQRSSKVNGCVEKLNKMNQNFNINYVLLSNVDLVNYTEAK